MNSVYLGSSADEDVQAAMAARLRKLATGRVEWRVQHPTEKCFCMSFDASEWVAPELRARQWLAEFRKRFPNHEHSKYEVAEFRAFTELELAALEAADLLAAPPAGKGE